MVEYKQRLRDGELPKEVSNSRKVANKRKGRRRCLSIGSVDHGQQTLKDLWTNLKDKASKQQTPDRVGKMNVQIDNEEEAENQDKQDGHVEV